MGLVRGLAGLAACAVASQAAAQTSDALFGAAFAKPSDSNAFSSGKLFADPASPGAWTSPTLFGSERYVAGEGLTRWRTREAAFAAGDGTIDTLSVSVGGLRRAPLGPEADEAFDVTYTRGWVGAVRGRSGDLAFDVTPRAGLGVSNAGGQAIAGAMVRFGDIDFEDQVKDRLSSIGVPMVTDGARFGDRARWYLFAAADGRAVGFNLLRGPGGWSREGLTTDAAAIVGEAQVGVGWRKGAMQASFGVLAREIKHKPAEGLDEAQLEDQAVAFTLSIKPR